MSACYVAGDRINPINDSIASTEIDLPFQQARGTKNLGTNKDFTLHKASLEV